MAGDETKFTVCDLNAVEAPRRHRARDAHGALLGEYTFELAERKPMPAQHALAFVGKDGFEVRDDQGRQLAANHGVQVEDGGGIQLGEGEVVARVDELKNEALVRRAEQLPGGARFNMRSKRDDLVGFVLAGGDQPQPEPEPAEDDLTEMAEE